jgi:hypothetical protein
MQNGKMKKITPELREQIFKICQEFIDSPDPPAAKYYMLGYWVAGLLENIDSYPDWFVENKDKSNA